MEDKKIQQSILLKSLLCGFVGAFIWGLTASISYFFSFSQVSHASFLLRSFFTGSWTEGITGELISLVILSVIGIIPALIYYLLFRRAKGLLPGLLYGLALWGIVFVLMQPFFSFVPSIRELSVETVVTTICQFILYGVFVGYTISYEQSEANIIMSKNSQNET
ncbi:YqhR family membrane protein [Bacillaceae bacterium W0354]